MDTGAMEQRYHQPVRLSLTPPPAGAWDSEQLFVPELQAQKFGKDQMFEKYDEHLAQRQNQVSSSTGPDRDRAQLMYTAELTGMQRYVSEDLAQGAHPTSVAALELRQDKLMHQRSMAQLVSYDRQHQHPMHDQSRHPDRPASLDEKRQWSERDGRQTTHDELVNFGQQGGFNLFRHRAPDTEAHNQGGTARQAKQAPSQASLHTPAAAIEDHFGAGRSVQRPINLRERLTQRQTERDAVQKVAENDTTTGEAQAVNLSGLSFMSRSRARVQTPSATPAQNPEQQNPEAAVSTQAALESREHPAPEGDASRWDPENRAERRGSRQDSPLWLRLQEDQKQEEQASVREKTASTERKPSAMWMKLKEEARHEHPVPPPDLARVRERSRSQSLGR